MKSCGAEHGLGTWSVTCDGKSTNLNTFENLGCVCNHDYNKILISFKQSTRSFQVYASLDACHCVKFRNFT